MRKLLITTFGLACTAVLAVGGVMAWTGSASGVFGVGDGTISVALANVVASGNEIYPTNAPIAVDSGAIANNTPNDPGIPVHVTGGTVTLIHTNPTNAPCDTYINASGVIGDVTVSNNAPVAPNGAVGDAWTARITMGPTAPDDCKGKVLNYTVTINVAT